ncbi:hypothetical protein L596_024400 [Steinernema carpocapsae]|uniref:Peptidase S1 domain-containing protein n=1 Tax=Steinernema carpocapsae TaxID=34508 RepID=A0A4U5MGM8_STECR|nr:hypothetical protein L596_024400 [Steinernema carpocapsae]
MELLAFLCFVGVTVAGPLNNVGPSKLVVYGSPATRSQFSFYAYLDMKLQDPNAYAENCGASILSERYLLTASHCVANLTFGSNARTTVYINAIDRRDLKNSLVQALKVRMAYAFPNPNPKFTPTDCAVLELMEPIKFINKIQPIAVARNWQKYTQEGQIGTLVGLGNRDLSTPSNVLLFSHLNIQSREMCYDIFGGDTDKKLNANIFCAGKGKHGSGAGDSGGPFVIEENGRRLQIGISMYSIKRNLNNDHFSSGFFRAGLACDFIEKTTYGTVKCV